jgi:hypothetical protein
VATQTVRVCRDCGAVYATPGLAMMHTKATGHDSGFKTAKRTIPDEPSKISYQPGYGPKG